MLLARKGYKVLVVDRSTFPSDIISTHLVHTPAVAALERWGLLDRVTATGCPPIERYLFDFGFFTISGSPASEGQTASYAPRRIVLDKILVDAAAEAGAEVREGVTVEEVVVEDGRVVGIRGHGRDGASVTERARLVIGADGRNSLVASAVQPDQYNEKEPVLAAYYAYWSDLPTDGFETYIRPNRGWAAFPTNDGQTCLVGGWPASEFEANRSDVEGNFLKALEYDPPFAERVRGAKRESKFVGASLPGFFRKPFGPGWALVGDAGYNKDPITAQGILDAFRDAELVANATDEALSGARSYDDAMTDYQQARDTHVLPMYDFTFMLASLEPPPPEVAQVLGAVAADQGSMDAFIRMAAGAMSPAEFFAPDHIGQIMAAAAAPS
jgi:2-polyprenyl-6-methoxyphenol hydroxylase-like FAD-dependent oxidoreductase